MGRRSAGSTLFCPLFSQNIHQLFRRGTRTLPFCAKSCQCVRPNGFPSNLDRQSVNRTVVIHRRHVASNTSLRAYSWIRGCRRRAWVPINGLALLVEQALGLDPFAPAVFVFSNRRRDRIKILLWERTGFWLMIKRLEADRFKWPKDAEIVTLSVEQLHWLLSGIDLAAMRPHPERKYLQAG